MCVCVCVCVPHLHYCHPTPAYLRPFLLLEREKEAGHSTAGDRRCTCFGHITAGDRTCGTGTCSIAPLLYNRRNERRYDGVGWQ